MGMNLRGGLSSVWRRAGAEGRPVESGNKKHGRAISVRHKLFLSFGLIASLTIVASGVAIYAFSQSERGFDGLVRHSLPAIRNASTLAVQSNNVILLAANLLGAEDSQAQEQVHDRLADVTGRFLTATDEALNAAGSGNVDLGLRDNATRLVENLTKLDVAIGRRLAANAAKTARLGELFKLHEELASGFVPMVDDAYFTLLTGGQDVKSKSTELVDSIVNKDMVLLRAFLDARVEVNLLAGVLVAAELVDTVAEMKPFEDRATAAQSRLESALTKIAAAGHEFDFIKQAEELATYGVGPKSIFAEVARTGDLSADRPAVIAKVLDLQARIDTALIVAIDDATFDLAIRSDETATENGELVTNLLDKQVTSLKDALTTTATLHEMVATLVQGALTDDESQIVPIQDKVIAHSAKIREIVTSVERPAMRAKFEELLTFGDPGTGLLAGRGIEFEARRTASELVTEMLALSGGLGGQLEVMIDTQRKAVESDAAAVSDQIGLGRIILIVLGVASLAIAGAVGIFMVDRGLARPLAATIEAMRKLAAGDLDIALPSSDRRDEIGAMARAVAVFHENALTRVRLEGEQAEAAAAETARQRRIESLIADFRSSVQQMLNSVGANMEQMRETAKILSEIADDTSAKAGTAAAASDDTSGNIQTVAAATDELNASIGEIGRQIGQAMTVTSQATDTARTTNANVGALAAAAEEIGNVVSLIQGIAEQTNLLALNATIEAARAGEMGKGFAVVASEVKTLANQTAKATEEIGRKIQMIQESTQGTVAAIQAIVEQIEEVNGFTAAVSSAVEQQGGATAEINQSVQMAARSSNQVVDDMRGVTRTAAEATQSAAQVERASGEVADQAKELRLLCDRFLEQVAAA
jgi:methyl-accepting chemotaxis protein